MATFPYRPPRHDVVRPALVILESGQRLSCLIRNISRRGACISMVNADTYAARFDLTDKFTREQWQAEVRWHGSDRIGLRLFGSTPSLAPAPPGGFGKRR
jgi:hypothetical protein